MADQVKIAVQRPDGGVSIVTIILDDGHGIKREYSTALAEAEMRRAGLGGLPFRRIEDDEIPADRAFRNAWTIGDSGPLDIDMEKAVEIHKDALRKVRAPLLQALDIEMMKAWATGDTEAGQEVEAKKQALRDVTADPRIAAAKTPEELKAVVPEVLASVEAVKA